MVPKLARDLFILGGSQVVSKLIGLSVFALLARKLDPVGYGAVEYVVGLGAFFAMAVDCGLGTVGVRRIAESRAERPALGSQIPMARFLIALIAAPIMVALAKVFGAPVIPGGLVWLFAAGLLCAAWYQDWLLQSAELMGHVALAQTLRAGLFAVVVFVLVRGPADVVAVGWAEFISSAVLALYYVGVQQSRVTPLRIGLPVAKLRGLIVEGASLGASTFVWAATQYLPLFLVGNIVSGAELGWFAAALRLVTSLAAFSLVYHFNLYPTLARAAADSARARQELLTHSFRATAWAGIGVALAVTLAAVPILTTIYGSEYAKSAPVLAIAIWIVPIMLLSGHARWSLIVAHAQSRVLYSQCAGLASCALAGVPLIKAFGIVGAAATAVIANLAVWVCSHAFASLRHTEPPPVWHVARPLATALAVGLAVQYSGLGALANAGIGLVLFVVLAPLVDRKLLPDALSLAHAKDKWAQIGD